MRMSSSTRRSPSYVRASPGAAADAVGRTHPELVGAGGHRDSACFTDPVVFYAESNRAPLAPPAEPVVSRGFSRGDLAALRAFVGETAERRGVSRERSLALAQSVGEVAGHLVRNGGGRGSVRMWSADGRFLGYFPPTPYQPAGAGMWAVRQLCDLVEIRSGSEGSVVRLHMRHRPRPTGAVASPPERA